MSRILAITAVVVALAVGAVAYQFRLLFAALAYPERARIVSQHAVDNVVAWAAQQKMPPGQVRSIRLPLRYSLLSVKGYADVARLKDGRTCVLLVESIGYKENFEGVLSCSATLLDSELVRSQNYKRTYVSLPGYGQFEELYVSSKRNDRTYDVYFDLN